MSRIVWNYTHNCWIDLSTGELLADNVKGTSLKTIVGTTPKEVEFDPRDIKVYVIGHNAYETSVFRKRNYNIVQNADLADVIVWLGGEDISPQLYGERPCTQVRHVNLERDVQELGYWRKGVGKFKVGICRGGQLLNVLNGGKLWQHVTNHSRTHDMIDILTGRTIKTSSVHHQAFRPTKDAEIVAVAHESGYKESETDIWDVAAEPKHENATDYEVVYYPETRSLCFQGHPEYTTPPECSDYFFELVKRYYKAA